jgi:asparagine synthase (glutamine-hydrolysing)
VTAFCNVYDRLIPDQERHYSVMAAEGLAIPIHHLAIDDFVPFSGWDDWHPPEPINEPLAARSLDLQRQATSHGRVILTGQGGDALLYSTPLVKLLATGRWGHWLARAGGYLLGYGKLPPLGLRSWLRNWWGRDQHSPPLPDWLAPDFTRRAEIRDRWQELTRRPAEEHPTHPVAHYLLGTPFWASLFEAYDPGVTGIPSEFRHPLFDLRLITCVFGLPPIPWCIDKNLTRAAMRGLLPERIRTRRKTPLPGDPLHEILRRRMWRWSDCLSARSPVREYVTLERVVASMQRYEQPGGGSSCAAVLPFCLDYWLRSLLFSIPQPPFLERARGFV